MESIADLLAPFRHKAKVEMRWSDLDEAGHVNNAVYLTYFEQARIHYFHDVAQWDWKEYGVILASSHIDYISPLYFPTDAYIYTRTRRVGTKSFEVECIIVAEKDGIQTLVTKGYTTLVMFDFKTKVSYAIPDFIRDKLFHFEPSLKSS